MVESSVLGTSPWNSDPFLCKDLNPFPGLDCQSLLDMGLNEPEICSTESLPFVNETAIALEDPTERICQDFFLSGHDYLAPSSVSSESSIYGSILAHDSSCAAAEDSLHFESLSGMMEESSWHSDSSSEATLAPPITTTTNSPRKKNKAQNPLAPSKSWSRMTGEEQLGTVEALTQIISHQMGLREQLEVIRIIDPQAVVSTMDTEFVIDLGCLDDVKLQRIREHVTKHAQELGTSQGSVASRMGGQSDGSSSSSGLSSLNSETGSSSSSSGGSTSGKPSKKQLREQHKQWKAWRQRQRKEQRQVLKERRSGLFVKNEILWVNGAEDGGEAIELDPDEDIDILA